MDVAYTCIDRSDFILLALAVFPKIPTLIPEAGCGQRPHF